jgi:RNA-directed DNA polymerase
VKDRTTESKPSVVPARAPQEGEIRARWAWVEPEVWTERMLATLETGIEGGKWFRLIDKVWSPKNLRRSLEKVWPNSHFSTLGLLSLKQAHFVACRSS